jgi:hypothetical protein
VAAEPPSDPAPEAATEWLRTVERRFRTLSLPEILECFADDVITHYNLLPPILGRQALGELLRERYTNMKDYRLQKSLRCTGPDGLLGVEVNFSYVDVETAIEYCGKGYEYLLVKNGLIASWEYVSTVLPSQATHKSELK